MAETLGPLASLVIELTVDTREEEGWREWVEYRDKPRYQQITNELPRSWDQAESYCEDF